MHSGLKVLEGIISVQPDSTAKVLIENTSGFTQTLDANELLGHTSFVQAVDLKSLDDMHCDQSPLEHGQKLYDYIVKSQAQVNFVQSDNSHSRQARLYQLVKWDSSTLQNDDSSKLKLLIGCYHDAFRLSDDDRGETDLVQLVIDTGDAPPKKLPVRRVPFAVHKELARQLQSMEQANVIQPSHSPWASPMVLVQKKDNSLHLCVDFRALNAVSKLDTFPIPHIDNLLDQLHGCKFFSTLDFASGYWQVKVHVDSIEKTAFITPQGLTNFV